jgi:hypothetical protein
MDDAAEEVYAIDSIVTFSRTRNRFFLSWQGYPPSSNTWEPFKSFDDKMVPMEFLSKLKLRGIICDNCIKIAKSSASVTPGSVCECAKRCPSPIATPGKRVIDLLKQSESQKCEDLPVNSKRSRGDASFDASPSSSSPAAKVAKKLLPSTAVSRPSEAVSKKATPRPKTHTAISLQAGSSSSDDDNEPLRTQVKTLAKQPSTSTKQATQSAQSSPATPQCRAPIHHDTLVPVRSSAACSPLGATSPSTQSCMLISCLIHCFPV